MRGDGGTQLYREVKPPSSKKRSRSGVKDSFTAPADADLFDALREVADSLYGELPGIDPAPLAPSHDLMRVDHIGEEFVLTDDVRALGGAGRAGDGPGWTPETWWNSPGTRTAGPATSTSC